MKNDLILWQNPEEKLMPSTLTKVEDIVGYANNKNLSEKQQAQIVKAFNMGSFEMSAEYAWQKAIIKLRKSLEKLGVDFLAELMERSDIDEFTPVDEFLTDRKAIDLAEQLGLIGKTGALKLRQHYVLMNHFLSGDADEELKGSDALGIIYDSVQYILCEQNEGEALAFSEFRNRILGETVSLEDADVKQVLAAPLFYIRTVCMILLNAIKKEKGVKQEHALTNLNTIIKDIWEKIAEKDKYSVGFAYSSVIAYGDNVAAKGLKQALMKVYGFDYVPETTRSTTFRDQAKKVIDIHYGFNNFYNEPGAVRSLEKLGSIIPAPAFQDCIDAYLCVYLGNWYNISIEAAPIAERELLKVSVDRWHYVFSKLIHQDYLILDHIETQKQINRFALLLEKVGFTSVTGLPKYNQMLYEAIMSRNMKASLISAKLKDSLRYKE